MTSVRMLKDILETACVVLLPWVADFPKLTRIGCPDRQIVPLTVFCRCGKTCSREEHDRPLLNVAAQIGKIVWGQALRLRFRIVIAGLAHFRRLRIIRWRLRWWRLDTVW
jgi:hypothetical protein